MSGIAAAATPLWAALLALLYVALAVLVIRARYRTKTAIGSGGDARLERAIRAHANFAEYVPLTVVLLLLAELQGAWPWLLHLLGAALLVGRALHAYGISNPAEVYSRRQGGMVLTFTVLVTAALANLVLLWR